MINIFIYAMLYILDTFLKNLQLIRNIKLY